MQPVLTAPETSTSEFGSACYRALKNKRYAQALGLEFIDADYGHTQWKESTWKLRNEPERGERCLHCFKIRLTETARFAQQNGYTLFTTTLATSRWINLEQINLG
jgi:predicted adenine nucleotide alpha hydrolase (AANH) superfamily ATPase